LRAKDEVIAGFDKEDAAVELEVCLVTYGKEMLPLDRAMSC
jgi:hypothetical protein